MMVGYAARRFAPGRVRLALAASLAISVLAIIFVPSFDAKAWIALFGSSIICLACAFQTRHRLDGKIAIGIGVLFGAMLVCTSQDALDRGYYLFVAAILGALLTEQILDQRRLQIGLAFERERGDTLEDSLAAARATGDPIISFRDGAKIHRVPERNIVRITAADDFCEVLMIDRRPLLISETLKSLTASLPDRFLRVHKSHVVNLARVTGVCPRPGGGHQVVHSDGSSTPVGRTYREMLVARLKYT
jgi:hypothetical protein